MNEEREEEERRCCLQHPKELVIGICALCLKERLSSLLLASSKHKNKKHKIRLLPKIFAITSLINSLDIKHHKSDQVHDDDDDDDDDDDEAFFSSTTSQEADSFISIKFEDNGVGSWEKGKTTKDHEIQINSLELENHESKIKSLVGHTKPRAAMRWRKRIGHLLHLTGWKSKGGNNTCHVGTKLEGVKVKRGWIRILTKRRTKE